MSYTRRGWIGRIVSAVPSYFVQPLRSVASQPPPPCSGEVHDPGGRPLDRWTVQLFPPDGNIDKVVTNDKGHYEFKGPIATGPYYLTFRDQNGVARHEVRRLTRGFQQIVSVTIDPNAKTFEAVYNGLQSLEALASFAHGAVRARDALRMDLGRIPEAVSEYRKAFAQPSITPGQRGFLTNKANNIEMLAKVPFVSGPSAQ